MQRLVQVRSACRFDEVVARGEVRDRNAEARRRLLDEAALDPVRPARGKGRNDDLVCGEARQRVFDRPHRVGVADLPAGDDAAPVQRGVCSEALWWRCHRRLVADRWVVAGDTVITYPAIEAKPPTIAP
jgi:hypothetical protein